MNHNKNSTVRVIAEGACIFRFCYNLKLVYLKDYFDQYFDTDMNTLTLASGSGNPPSFPIYNNIWHFYCVFVEHDFILLHDISSAVLTLSVNTMYFSSYISDSNQRNV